MDQKGTLKRIWGYPKVTPKVLPEESQIISKVTPEYTQRDIRVPTKASRSTQKAILRVSLKWLEGTPKVTPEYFQSDPHTIYKVTHEYS